MIQTQTPSPKLARARLGAWCLRIDTPSSSPPASPRGSQGCDAPGPQRSDFRALAPDADVGAVLFDFDGTLTSVPGGASRRTRRQLDLFLRAPLLEPRLRVLRDAGLSLGIISKSSEATIRTSLAEAGLCEFFDGPLVANAVGFDGKAGFIEDLVQGGSLRHLGPSGLRRVLLVDDDLQELEHARARGVQVYAAPEDGGLQEPHLEELLLLLGLQAPTARSAASSCDGAAPVSATSTTVSWASPAPSPLSSQRSPSCRRPGSSPGPQGASGRVAVGSPLGAEDMSEDEELIWMTPGCPDSCATAPRGARLLFGRAGRCGAALGLDSVPLAWEDQGVAC